MNINETRLGLFEKEDFLIAYWLVMFFFIIGFLLFLISGGFLFALFFLVGMLIFSIQWGILKFIKIEDNKIIVQSVFFRDILHDLNSLKDISAFLPFSSIMRIRFNDGKRYFFWGGNDKDMMNRLRREGRIK